jgi:hypothetical protein
MLISVKAILGSVLRDNWKRSVLKYVIYDNMARKLRKY